jgi:hypothetical protein
MLPVRAFRPRIDPERSARPDICFTDQISP